MVRLFARSLLRICIKTWVPTHVPGAERSLLAPVHFLDLSFDPFNCPEKEALTPENWVRYEERIGEEAVDRCESYRRGG